MRNTSIIRILQHIERYAANGELLTFEAGDIEDYVDIDQKSGWATLDFG